jgi:hypothetical protein
MAVRSAWGVVSRAVLRAASPTVRFSSIAGALPRCREYRVGATCGLIAPQSGSLDHLVGEGKEGWRHVEAKRFGSFEVDHHFELGWLDHW